MQISHVTLLLASVGAVLSTALPTAALASKEGAVLEARDGNTASCNGVITFEDAAVQWYQWYIPADGPWVRNDWAQGFLDKLRNQCGEVIFWTYNQDSEGQWAARFWTSFFIRKHCIEDAIWLASQSTGSIGGATCDIRSESEGRDSVKFPKPPKPLKRLL